MTRWFWGKTWRLWSGKYLTIKITHKKMLPPDWRARALEMFNGRRPADAEFLALAWLHEQMHSQEVERRRCVEVGQLQRKLATLRNELRGRVALRRGEKL